MAIWRSSSPSQDPSSSLRLPASKRITSTASLRLSTIMEGDKTGAAPDVPKRSSLRPRPASAAIPLSQHPALRSQETLRNGPPAYGAHAPSIGDSEDLTAPVEGEKLARLRRGEGDTRRSRGGWWRLALIAAIIIIVIGLAVGLGVGLTVGRRSGDNTSNTNSGSTTAPEEVSPQFPLGEYTFVTALRTQQTNCTSQAASWRCYPYSTFSTSNTSSLTAFNWIITNTSADYASSSSGATSSSGVPANLTISSTNNPFSAQFTNQSLTYISDSSNSSSARYEFSFIMSKVVIPSPAITSNGQVSECFFNSTTFSATIYLNAARTYPNAALLNSTSIGGYDQWPYAVNISQISPGGQNIPDCYEMINGNISDRIINVLTPQPESSQCICDYRNF